MQQSQGLIGNLCPDRHRIAARLHINGIAGGVQSMNDNEPLKGQHPTTGLGNNFLNSAGVKYAAHFR
eukprot:scaffold161490_cov33-Prasinocladus_malaysianus.AAC.9